MFSPNLSNRGILKLTRPLLAALVALVMIAAALYLPLSRVQAQEGTITVRKTLAGHGPVVRVGERLTFIIQITNNSTFTLTTLPLSDTYRADILALASSDLNGIPMPPDSQASGGNTITLFWNNLTSTLGSNVLPGQVITVTTVFTAEHPGTAVVNAAEVHDAVDNGGHSGLSGNSQEQNDATGGAAPVDKRLMPITTNPALGMLIGFTITITNHGAARMTQLPLRDIYDPAALQFSYAIPPPDEINAAAGELRWRDLTTYFGDLPGDAVIQVPVYFTVTQALQTAFNRAEVEAAIDEYNNILTAGADEVPITVIMDELRRLINQKKKGEHHDEGPDVAATAAAQANAYATAEALAAAATTTAEASITATPTPQGPRYLPETGHSLDLIILLAAGLGILGVGWGVRAFRQ